MLIALHKQILPDLLPVAPHVNYRLPAYDLDAFLIEVELLLDWYLPYRHAPSLVDRRRAEFLALWRDALQPAVDALETWVLRDFHSPNLIWLPDRRGIACLGLLDFQDAVLGPAAYDLASLLQDARVDVPDAWETELLRNYVRARSIDDPKFDAARLCASSTPPWRRSAPPRSSAFLRGSIGATASRNILRHLPRVWNYLQRALAHPALAPLAAWYKANVPPPEASSR